MQIYSLDVVGAVVVVVGASVVVVVSELSKTTVIMLIYTNFLLPNTSGSHMSSCVHITLEFTKYTSHI